MKTVIIVMFVMAVSASPVAAYDPTGRPGVERARAWLRERTSDRAFRCAHRLWDNESSWRVHAGEPAGPYGIPQANPGRKMRRAEHPRWGKAWDSWRHDALVQVAWGTRYVRARYGTFCEALGFQIAEGWY